MAHNLIIRPDRDDRVFSPKVAARIARASLELLELCEEEGLISTQPTAAGQRGLAAADVRHLARIRRLQEDLELDLAAVEVVLHMRERTITLLRQLEETEQRMAQQEQELHRRLRQLRRTVASDAEWE
jgi:DNA-binding transcriptional MerR regulator